MVYNRNCIRYCNRTEKVVYMCTKCRCVLGYTVAEVFISSLYVLVYTLVNYMFMQNITELSNPAPAAAPSSPPSSDSSSCQTPTSSSPSRLSQNSAARPGPPAPSTVLFEHYWLQHNASLTLQANNVIMYKTVQYSTVQYS